MTEAADTIADDLLIISWINFHKCHLVIDPVQQTGTFDS